VSGLTMTEIYNLVAALNPPRIGEDLENRASAARAGIIDQLHRQIDAAVAQAYGWPADLPASEIVSRLVALNAQRAAEEAAGHIRWLRPDYQIPRFGKA
jgi:Mg/Co/Ni transporter MgtE